MSYQPMKKRGERGQTRGAGEVSIVFDFECCDCEGCKYDGMKPRWECGCSEDICPDCGYCTYCCEGDHDEDAFIGQREDDA